MTQQKCSNNNFSKKRKKCSNNKFYT